MTIIAFRDGMLAADTKSSAGHITRGYMKKIGRTKDGHLWGFVGTADFHEVCSEWVEKREGKAPNIMEQGENSILILITPDHRVREWNGHGWYETDKCDFYAWGSAGSLALGAMAMGADAATACEVAIRFDNYCGGDITTLILEPVVYLPETCGPEDEAEFEDFETFAITVESPDGPAEPLETWREKRGLR